MSDKGEVIRRGGLGEMEVEVTGMKETEDGLLGGSSTWTMEFTRTVEKLEDNEEVPECLESWEGEE